MASQFSKKRTKSSIILICALFFVLIWPVTLNSNRDVYNDTYKEKNPNIIKTAYYNNSAGLISINDIGTQNWSWAKDQPWCTEVGGVYYIENLSINGQGALVSCIDIRNTNKPFIVRNCTLFNSTEAGIKLQNVSNCQLIDNICSFNGDSGIEIADNSEPCQNITIRGNTIYNNSDGIGIHSDTSPRVNITIIGNTIYNNSGYGIQLEDNCFNNTIVDNIIVSSTFGCYLSDTCYGNKILDNIIYSNGAGLVLSNDCDNNTIDSNNIFNSTYYGILLNVECNYNNILYNNIYDNNFFGIFLYNCSLNQVEHNEIYNNQQGTSLIANSSFNTIRFNRFYDNSIYGIDISNTCENNTIYYNRFSNPDGENAYDNGTNTRWDNGLAGNYWHDYNGTDADGDGIGDTPYNISGTGGGVDRYPLLENPSPPDDLLTIVAIVAAIASASAVAATSFFIFSGKSKKKKKKRTQSIDREKLIEYLEEEDGLELVSNLGDIRYTTLSEDFMYKVESLEWDEEEKALFLNEILSYSPEKRQGILDEMLGLSNPGTMNDSTSKSARGGD